MFSHGFHRLIFVGAKSDASPIGKHELLAKPNTLMTYSVIFERPAANELHLMQTTLLFH
ncbi:hypothetical protein ACVIHI_000557 [Bradyrhizobium sp. USDA 4524]|uniref:hypothetical protein n=1 Tax=Bradyrhizobium TaxID=374 RepID=UPI000AA73792|nr:MULTISPECIES: hypothetical protein [Bradyrhizobium]MCP1838071.1 hypothetical protein [Bradyrhizobium sp. USDA 4538]MCP1898636.1 hypothetical protein [Bradyrhizobium sp. USDA 4537]MCP1987254.1 hypothetical protein [Bradyrhizobium sp. USDA 4539]